MNGSFFDSHCEECDAMLLYNDRRASSLDPLLQQELNVSLERATRRWVLPHGSNDSMLVSSEGCLVACVNNYVWIDTRTGRFPRSTKSMLMPYHACIRCSSAFITQASQPQQQPLYSVWNYQGARLALKGMDSALWDVQGFAGGCFACPPNTDTVEGTDIMYASSHRFVVICRDLRCDTYRCQSMVGFGVPVGTPTYVTIVRGDLSSSSILPTHRVPSMRTPLLIHPSNQEYFSCCGEDNLCKIFLKSTMDLDQAHFTAGSFYVSCTNNVTGALYTGSSSRRLLQSSSTGVQACFSGQYNDERGNDVCYSCPQGS